ncbi:MAG TPA: GNAT family N-acetyltransferase [Allosphingosinicella sp.]|jgi:CelD/BcsL family acetyltransferase involved in cellulose biosynthesis
MLLQRIDLAEAAPTDIWPSAPAAAPRSMADHWDDLAANASEPNVFAERWFVGPGVRNMLSPGRTRMIAVWANGGDTLVGLLPLRIEERYGRTPVRHVQNWVHDHAFLGTPLVRRGREREFWAEILATLDGADWAPGFLHLTGIAEDGPVHRGLAEAAAAAGRPCAVVHRMRRALLESGLTPQAYQEAAVRKKKRKELGRLRSRLAELGDVRFETLERPEDAPGWCEDFLALEAAGWKGKDGSAFAREPRTAAFFREMFAGAFEAGKLEVLRLAVDGKPIAMLVNLHAEGGGFSYKIAFDEDYARYSPGVMIEIENLRLLARPGFAWMDSCAAEDHPMIDSLWRERRSIVRLTVPLAGAKRAATFRICRALEDGSALVRRLRNRRNA